MADSISRLRPSGAGMWSACPGSVEAQEGYPNTSSPAAVEGTRAHQLLSYCLTQGVAPMSVLSLNDEDEAAELWEPNDEMVGYIQDALDYIHGIGGQVYSEIEVDASGALGFPLGTVFGTADVVVLHPDNVTIEVIDLKYGAGVFVDHLNNKQMAVYTTGALGTFPDKVFEIVKQTILQPRYHAKKEPRSETLTMAEFSTRVQELAVAAQAALSPGAKRVPGESQCRWCRAKPCPEHIAKAGEIAEKVFKPIHAKVSAGTNVTSEELAEFKDNIPLFRNMISDIEEEIYKRLSAGVRIPGYKLGEGKRGARRWLDAEAAQQKLQRFKVGGKVLGLDGSAPRKVISPAGTDKLKLTDRQKKILTGLWEQAQGKPTVVPDSDPRPAVDVGSGFSAVEDKPQATPEPTPVVSFL